MSQVENEKIKNSQKEKNITDKNVTIQKKMSPVKKCLRVQTVTKKCFKIDNKANNV